MQLKTSIVYLIQLKNALPLIGNKKNMSLFSDTGKKHFSHP